MLKSFALFLGKHQAAGGNGGREHCQLSKANCVIGSTGVQTGGKALNMKKMETFDTGFHAQILVRFCPYRYPYQSLTATRVKAAALVFYHLCMLLLWRERKKFQEGSENRDEISVSLPRQYIPPSISPTRILSLTQFLKWVTGSSRCAFKADYHNRSVRPSRLCHRCDCSASLLR